MHRTFAGILGAAAFAVVLGHGCAMGSGPSTVVPRATLCLVLFAIAGAAVGRIALWTVEEGVAAQLHESLAATDKTKNGNTKR